MGRPSSYTPELAQEICERLARGEPLTIICRDEGMPCDNTVRAWADRDEGFSADIARARETGFDQIALDALAIADETHRDTKRGKDGQETPDSEWITRSRLRVETRLKLLSKWDPKRYGERTTIAGDPDAPLSQPADPAAALAAILATAAKRRDGDAA